MPAPSKEEIAAAAAARAAAAEKQRTAAAFTAYTTAIDAAMLAGQTSYQDRTGNVSPEVERQLRAYYSNFTLKISNQRTGCTISWS